jgi:hypothetical protein
MTIEKADIQGVIVSGYRHLPWSRYLFLHVDDADRARRWLSDLVVLAGSPATN